jgi:Lrp/AsnC family leucine-responsive transcriptional regulator
MAVSSWPAGRGYNRQDIAPRPQQDCERCIAWARARTIRADNAGRTREMTAIELDRIDIQLLAELQRAGRQTNAELAERVHLSPSACLRRVQRLEREGVIAGYRAELDGERLGLGLQAFVRVHLARHDAEALATFAAHVNDCPEVVACHALTGEMDYLLHIVVGDLEHFSRFLLDRLLAQAGVADVNSSFVLRTIKGYRGLPLPAPARGRAG